MSTYKCHFGGNSRRLCNVEECMYCFHRSFECNPKSKFWSLKNDVPARLSFLNSNKKAKFDCECGHEFEAVLNSISSKGSWCPYCSPFNGKLCFDSKCLLCFNKSFASHEKAKFWSNKNKLKAREVSLYSHKKFKFDCECGHEFEKVLSNISNGQWCPYCSIPGKKLCGNPDCLNCFSRSFASHKKSKYFSPKNGISVLLIFLGSSSIKFLFDCEKGHEFSTKIARVADGIWCPLCYYKTEEKVFMFLKTLFPSIEREKKFDWCISIRKLKYDFYIPELNMFIEVDGDQHFTQISNWDSADKTREKDVFKMKQAFDRGFSMIRLIQTEVLEDSYDWQEFLRQRLFKQTSSKLIAKELSPYQQHLTDLIKLYQS